MLVLSAAAASGGSAVLLHKAGVGAGAQQDSVAATLTPITAGNFITVTVMWGVDASLVSANNITVSGITDTNSNAYVAVSGTLTAAGTVGARLQIWCAKNISNAVSTTNVITASWLAVGQAWYPSIMVEEWSGISTASPVDTVGNNVNFASTATPSISTNGSTNATGELIYSSVFALGKTPVATQSNIQSVGGLNDEFQLSTALGSYTNSWSWSGAVAAVAVLAAFH